MSVYYTKSVASCPSKIESRKKVATSIINNMGENPTIHYLGGTSTTTPFENHFKNRGRNPLFLRYEKMRSIKPRGYEMVEFDRTGNPILPTRGEKGYFLNGDFFDCFFAMEETIQSKENHFWLDFCGTPKNELLEMLYYSFFHEPKENFKSLYLTFFLNPRNCKDAKEMFCNGEKTIDDRANTLSNIIQKMIGEDFVCGVFDTYINGKSPMAVLKIERRENKDMAKTASTENYVRLHKRGFTNKQIAIFWKAGIMQVAGFAASAKRQKLI
jgi:hypothetical protein